MVTETEYLCVGLLKILKGVVSELCGLESMVFRRQILDRISEENEGINYSGFRVISVR